MCTVSIYLDNGLVFEYQVDSPAKGREHAHKIITTGYRHAPQDSDDLEWFPAHRIDKIKVSGAGKSTHYRDRVRPT